jgi:hypothetical protein
VREKYCSGWKNKPNKTDYKPDEHGRRSSSATLELAKATTHAPSIRQSCCCICCCCTASYVLPLALPLFSCPILPKFHYGCVYFLKKYCTNKRFPSHQTCDTCMEY